MWFVKACRCLNDLPHQFLVESFLLGNSAWLSTSSSSRSLFSVFTAEQFHGPGCISYDTCISGWSCSLFMISGEGKTISCVWLSSPSSSFIWEIFRSVSTGLMFQSLQSRSALVCEGPGFCCISGGSHWSPGSVVLLVSGRPVATKATETKSYTKPAHKDKNKQIPEYLTLQVAQ